MRRRINIMLQSATAGCRQLIVLWRVRFLLCSIAALNSQPGDRCLVWSLLCSTVWSLLCSTAAVFRINLAASRWASGLVRHAVGLSKQLIVCWWVCASALLRKGFVECGVWRLRPLTAATHRNWCFGRWVRITRRCVVAVGGLTLNGQTLGISSNGGPVSCKTILQGWKRPTLCHQVVVICGMLGVSRRDCHVVISAGISFNLCSLSAYPQQKLDKLWRKQVEIHGRSPVNAKEEKLIWKHGEREINLETWKHFCFISSTPSLVR